MKREATNPRRGGGRSGGGTGKQAGGSDRDRPGGADSTRPWGRGVGRPGGPCSSSGRAIFVPVYVTGPGPTNKLRFPSHQAGRSSYFDPNSGWVYLSILCNNPPIQSSLINTLSIQIIIFSGISRYIAFYYACIHYV